jgi:outer membrane protein OmpA-like peptidoglycan-associated protein
MRAKRTSGLKDVNVGILSSRLVGSMGSGGLKFLAGLGAGVSTETNFLHSYGLDALVGAKIAMGEGAALRLDGVWDWLANEEGSPPKKWRQYKTVRLGISLYRNPFRELRTVTVQTPAPPAQIVYREDTESKAALQALRDSLNAAPVCVAARVSSDQVIPIRKDAPDVMDARLGFACGRSELDEAATTLLDSKIAVVRANSAMTVVILGYSDGSDGYNMSLGTRRAQAAKDYIVAHGIAADRVVIQSGGVAPSGRTNLRLLIVPDVLRK